MRILLIIISIICFFSLDVIAQPKLTVNQTEMLIGDQFELTLQFEIPGNMEWINQDLSLPDTLKAIQAIEDIAPVITMEQGGQKVIKRWTAAPFDTGYIFIPQLPVVLQQNGMADTFYSNHIPVFVAGVEADSTGLAPIKDIIEEPKNWIDYLWVLILIGLITLIYFAYRLMKRKKLPDTEPEEIQRSAHEIALEHLDNLEEAKLWQKGEVKKYHVELTHIFREYLEGRYQIPALESTTEEISMALRKVGLSDTDRSEVTELLLQSDMVKFAKAKPRLEVHQELLNFARAFIIRTKMNLHIQEEEEE